MSADSWIAPYSAALLFIFGCAAISSAAPTASEKTGPARITVIYDAFGESAGMQKDWGYATGVWR